MDAARYRVRTAEHQAVNLHAAVRGQIPAVNADRDGVWRHSAGYTTAGDGQRLPQYTDIPVRLQIQSLTGRDLRHLNMLNIQGVQRTVYMYSNVQGVVRTDQKGGDLLLFSQDIGGAVETWKVVAVLETWTPDTLAWCKLGVTLQL